jgi:hypothetical protein
MLPLLLPAPGPTPSAKKARRLAAALCVIALVLYFTFTALLVASVPLPDSARPASDSAPLNKPSAAATVDTRHHTVHLIRALQCMVDELELWDVSERDVRLDLGYESWKRPKLYDGPSYMFVHRFQTVGQTLKVLRSMVQTRLGSWWRLVPSKDDRLIRVLQSMVDELQDGVFRRLGVSFSGDVSATMLQPISELDLHSCARACRANAACLTFSYAPGCASAAGCCSLRLLANGISSERPSTGHGFDLGVAERDRVYAAWLQHCAEQRGNIYNILLK